LLLPQIHAVFSVVAPCPPGAALREMFTELRTRDTDIGRLLIGVGVVLVLAGLLIQAGVPLGRLPGDIVVRRGSSSFYFPIVTCIVVSVVLSLVAYFLKR